MLLLANGEDGSLVEVPPDPKMPRLNLGKSSSPWAQSITQFEIQDSVVETLAFLRSNQRSTGDHMYALVGALSGDGFAGEAGPVWIWACQSERQLTVAVVSHADGRLLALLPMAAISGLLFAMPVWLKIVLLIAGIAGVLLAPGAGWAAPLVWILAAIAFVIAVIAILREVTGGGGGGGPGGGAAGGGVKKKAEELRDSAEKAKKALEDSSSDDPEKAAKALEEYDKLKKKFDKLAEDTKKDIDKSDLTDEQKEAAKKALDELKQHK